MKNSFLLLFSLLLVSSCDGETNKAPKCGENKEFVMSTYTKWINDGSIKLHTKHSEYDSFKAVDFSNIFEYKTPPVLLGTSIYSDYKNGRVCDATVSFEIVFGQQHKKTFKIDTRYQFIVPEDDTSTLNIIVNGKDMEDLSDKINEKLIFIENSK